MPPETLSFRSAALADLPQIVEMLADDFLGAQRERFEQPLPESYLQAFAEIERDANNELVVVEQNGEIVGTLQLTFIPSISFQGGRRAQIESVRVVANRRGEGIGKKMFRWAIGRAREKNCRMIQLSTNETRADAQRFYENLGFKRSHVGMKLYL
jgi:ribosomal protein S18 acetylase RimI-like enzyme